MSEADKKFLELGYEIILKSKTLLHYEKEGLYMDREIIFNLLDKNVNTEYSTGESLDISAEELKAIYFKFKEFKWIE